MPTPLNTNLLRNGDFTETREPGPDGKPTRSYKWRGINEIQLPFHWDADVILAQEIELDRDHWIQWVPPEIGVLYPGDLPPHERAIFTPDNKPKIKAFKGYGAIWFKLIQKVAGLTPGFYNFKLPVFPDMVDRYESGVKVWAADPRTAEMRLSATTPEGRATPERAFATNWINGSTMGAIAENKWRPFGEWYLAQLDFELPADVDALDLTAELRGQWPITNNGWLIAEASFTKVRDTAAPPTDPDTPPTDADVAQLALRLEALTGRYNQTRQDLIDVVEVVHDNANHVAISLAELLADLRQDSSARQPPPP